MARIIHRLIVFKWVILTLQQRGHLAAISRRSRHPEERCAKIKTHFQCFQLIRRTCCDSTTACIPLNNVS